MQPFEVTEISIGPALLGLSPLPGLNGDFPADIEEILNWKPSAIISLTEKKEMENLGMRDFHSLMANKNILWLHFPIKDFGIVDKQREDLWDTISKNVHQKINEGSRILVHCRGGCGRTGMIILRIMVEFGENPDKALQRLRKIRPCAVETKDQENWAKLQSPINI